MEFFTPLYPVLALNLTRMTIPELLFQPISMLGQAAIPIMLVSLGYRLHEFQSLKWRYAFGGALVRIFGGSTTASIVVQLIAAEGAFRAAGSITPVTGDQLY
jgi:predicted permease